MTLTRGIYILVSFLGACLMSAAFLAGTVPAQSSNRPPSLVGVEKFSAPSTEGADVIGARPNGWTVDGWTNSPALSLEKLRGKVVLVRWWTAPGCVFCEASAPALNGFWRTGCRRVLSSQIGAGFKRD
jgi:thiol-disulfide isomerase/thioredoxin